MTDVTITQVHDESVSEHGDAVLPITFDGETYNLRKLRPADLAAAEDHMRGKAISLLIESCRFVPVAPEAYGAAMATLASQPYDLNMLVKGQESRLHLLWLSLKRGGLKEPFAWAQNNIRTNLMQDLEDVLMWMSRLESPPKEPDDTTDPTTPGDQPGA